MNGCTIDEDSRCLLQQYGYPGNIRELRSIIQSAVNLAQGGVINSSVLPAQLQSMKTVAVCTPEEDSIAVTSLAEIEKAHILKVYRKLDRNKSQTARRLGIGMNTLRRKLKSYGVA